MGNFRAISSNPKKGPNGLTPLQQRFCEEYVKDYNATQAYYRASEVCALSTAGRNGHLLLKKPEVKAEIEKIQKAIFEAQFVNYERIAGELSEIAFHSTNEKNRLQALSLLQKQLGLDKTTITADINQKVEIKVGIDDGD